MTDLETRLRASLHAVAQDTTVPPLRLPTHIDSARPLGDGVGIAAGVSPQGLLQDLQWTDPTPGAFNPIAGSQRLPMTVPEPTAQPDDLDDATALPGHPSPARRRMLTPFLAAAAVLALVGGVGAVAQLRHHSAPTASGPVSPANVAQPAPAWDLRVADVPGYTMTRVTVVVRAGRSNSLTTIAATSTTRPERAQITRCPLPVECLLRPSTTGINVNYVGPGAGLKPIVDDNHYESVLINGLPGTFSTPAHVGPRAVIAMRNRYHDHPWLAANSNDYGHPTLAWYVGNHTTLFLQGSFGFDPKTYNYDYTAAKKIMMRIASATSAGLHDPVLVPFALNHLPHQLQPTFVKINRGYCIDYSDGVKAGENTLGVVLTACRVRTASTQAETIARADDIVPTKTAGVIVVDFPGGTSMVVAVARRASRPLTQAQARQFAEHANVAPKLNDPSTWIVVR